MRLSIPLSAHAPRPPSLARSLQGSANGANVTPLLFARTAAFGMRLGITQRPMRREAAVRLLGALLPHCHIFQRTSSLEVIPHGFVSHIGHDVLLGVTTCVSISRRSFRLGLLVQLREANNLWSSIQAKYTGRWVAIPARPTKCRFVVRSCTGNSEPVIVLSPPRQRARALPCPLSISSPVERLSLLAKLITGLPGHPEHCCVCP